MKRAKPRSLPDRETACISRISLSSLFVVGGALKSCIEGAEGLSIGRPVLGCYARQSGKRTWCMYCVRSFINTMAIVRGINTQSRTAWSNTKG